MRHFFLCFLVLVPFVFTNNLPAQEESFESLFDGKSLSQFRGYAKEEIGKGWTVVDGAIKFDGSSGNGDIITKETYEDFEFQVEWKISKGGNSGIIYLVRQGDPSTYHSGPEYQLLDNHNDGNGKNTKTSTAALYGLYAAEKAETKPAGQWNTTKIVVNKGKVEHWLNGKKVVETQIGSDEWNKLVEGSKFNDWKQFGKTQKGHIALQDHGGEVWFRNIKIKRLNQDD